MATLLSPDMLPEDIRNMDFGQASMPHAPEAQTPEVPYDTTTSAPDRPAIPLSPDMLSGNLRYDPCGTTYEPCEGGAIGMSRFHSNRTCIRSPTAIPSSQNTPLC